MANQPLPSHLRSRLRGYSADAPAVALRPAMRMLITAVTTPTTPVVAPMIAITIAATSIPSPCSYICILNSTFMPFRTIQPQPAPHAPHSSLAEFGIFWRRRVIEFASDLAESVRDVGDLLAKAPKIGPVVQSLGP